MKRYQITDGIQIVLAIVLTGSMAYAMQPTAVEPAERTQKAEVVQITESKPKAQPEAQETAKNEQIEPPAQTWQDNPQKCNQDTQYIAADPPFNCIDKPAPTASAAPAAARSVSISGNKETWLAASGIPRDQWQYVDMIVSRESGWNPCAYNPGLSDCSANPTSACGLAQSLPCGKQSKYGHWTDPVANLKWQYEYVHGRYYEGSPYVPSGMCAGYGRGYPCAVAFWTKNHWY
jgi:hypothetical protein